MAGTPALTAGTVLDGRFEIQSTLGRGGFSIAYLATDLTQNDLCVVKELAPTGAVRVGYDLDLSSVPGANPLRLRKRFLDEANMLANLESPGILHLRDAFEERGTAYFVTDMLPDSRTLDKLLAQEGRLASDQAQDILYQLLDILQAVHAHRVLHRDIKPTNILISPKGEVYLIDFGAAREWHADSAALQTVLFTPGYAPLEQLSDRGRRGPATDIYALCATAYHMLAGYPPRPAAERADGNDIVPLSQIRPDLDQPLVQAISAGLQLRFQDRPQSIAELRAILLVPDPEEASSTSLEHYDAAVQRLNRFSYNRNECPVCSGPLERPKPLKPSNCPVCRTGAVKPRHLPENLCAACSTGILHKRGDKQPILFCPNCHHGVLTFNRHGLLLKRLTARCPECEAVYEGDANGAAREGDQHTWPEWLAISKRAPEAWICDFCEALYEDTENGKWVEINARGLPGREYYPDEWARIAAGLAPDAGNSYCDECESDFWNDGETLTLLKAPHDPFRYATKYIDQPIPIADVPWLGAGKSSGNRGVVCPQCDTEFDEDGEFLRLVKSPSVRLTRYANQAMILEDWHRLSQGLPPIGEQEAFFRKMDDAMREAYLSGEIQFDFKNPSVLWSGDANRLEEENGEMVETGDGALVITTQEITFGKLLRKWRVPFDAVTRVDGDGNILELKVSGQESTVQFEMEPAELIVHLNSGDRSLHIDADLLSYKIKSVQV
ncbi:MAG TPA: protein kinase [Fimbriimonadaceae bacterium]|jgi:serine/threonine protein kinase